MKISLDDRFLYFYAKTEDPITSHTDPSWMMLFLDIDSDRQTGWQGYDYRVNRRVNDDTTTVVEHAKNGWNWQPKAEAKYRLQGNELMLAIPREALGLSGQAALRFEFKWADNVRNEPDMDEFIVNGDSAPLGRFNYLYVAERR